MKFWQLVSLMRGHQTVSASVLDDPEWQVYADWSDELETIVEAQDRRRLDAQMPEQLVRAALSMMDTVVYQSGDRISSTRWSDSDRAIPVRDIYDRFGGSVVEDVFERGSVNV